MERTEVANAMPIQELQSYVADLGDNLRPKALKLLNETRQEQTRLLESLRRKRIREFTARYDNLYLEFMEYDHWVSTYADMASRPWVTDDETGETTRQNIEVATLLNISAGGLLSQRETMRALLGDISSQLSSLNGEATNKLIIVMSVISLLIAFVSLIISFVALLK
jgi:hypothetical protein